MPRIYFTEAPLTRAADGVRIAVRLTPRGRVDRLESIAQSADGMPVLRASVTTPPAEGRANDTLLLLLARQLAMPRRDLAIVGGARSRNKIVHVAGEPASLLKRLAAALAALPRS